MTDLAILIAVVSGLTQVFKKATWLGKYPEFLALALGVILALAGLGFNFDALMSGLIVGLSASGLYDNVKRLS